MDAANHVLMEQQDGTLLLYVNDGTEHDVSNTGDVTTVMLSSLFFSQPVEIFICYDVIYCSVVQTR